MSAVARGRAAARRSPAAPARRLARLRRAGRGARRRGAARRSRRPAPRASPRSSTAPASSRCSRGSGLYHLWPWDPRWRPLLRRIDHSTIFVFIAASYTPVALLVLHGTTQVVVLGGVWLGALAGVTLSVAWIDAPRWLGAATYLALGWVALLAMPAADRHAARRAARADRRRRRPLLDRRRRLRDAAPRPVAATFGFHELFHAFVIAAAATHVVAIAGWVFPHDTHTAEIRRSKTRTADGPALARPHRPAVPSRRPRLTLRPAGVPRTA